VVPPSILKIIESKHEDYAAQVKKEVQRVWKLTKQTMESNRISGAFIEEKY